MSRRFEKERERLIRIAAANPRPCMVCDREDVVGIGSWIPDARQHYAAGGTKDTTPVFAFWLCRDHSRASEANDTLVRQAVLRSIR